MVVTFFFFFFVCVSTEQKGGDLVGGGKKRKERRKRRPHLSSIGSAYHSDGWWWWMMGLERRSRTEYVYDSAREIRQTRQIERKKVKEEGRTWKIDRQYIPLSSATTIAFLLTHQMPQLRTPPFPTSSSKRRGPCR
jgi:hypothetical protein